MAVLVALGILVVGALLGILGWYINRRRQKRRKEQRGSRTSAQNETQLQKREAEPLAPTDKVKTGEDSHEGTAIDILADAEEVQKLNLMAAEFAEEYQDGLSADEIVKEMRQSQKVKEIPGSDLKIVDVIGEGSFKTVYRGQYRKRWVDEDGQEQEETMPVAICSLKFDVEPHESEDTKRRVRAAQTREFMHEANVNVQLGNHSNIISFIGACYGAVDGQGRSRGMGSSSSASGSMISLSTRASRKIGDKHGLMLDLSFVTELCIGSLYDVMYLHRYRLHTARKKRIAFNVIDALVHLHANRMIHRDLKSHNILLNKDLEALICDFGTVKLRKFSYLTTKHKGAGTPGYMAPEQFRERTVLPMNRTDLSHTKVTEKSDIWAFGCVVMELFLEVPPWSSRKMRTVRQKDEDWLPPEAQILFSSGYDPEAIEVARDCMNLDPEERPTAVQIRTQLESWGWQVRIIKIARYSESSIFFPYSLSLLSSLLATIGI